jgi:surface protein
MSGMFFGAIRFNQPIGTWNTSKVTNMSSMFNGATNFNQSLNTWNTAAVTNMSSMFTNTGQYDQSMSNWDTSKVTNMSSMFLNALAVDQNISMWNISLVTSMTDILRGAVKFSQTNYHALLNSWGNGTTPIQNNVTFTVDQEYSSTNATIVSRRLYLINTRGWNIIDYGNETSMIITYVAGNYSINGGLFYSAIYGFRKDLFEIFATAGDTIVEVNWGNGQNFVYSPGGVYSGFLSPTHTSGTTYTIRITKRSGLGIIDFGPWAYYTYGSFNDYYYTPFQTGVTAINRFGSNIRLRSGGAQLAYYPNLVSVSPIDAPINPPDNSYRNIFVTCSKFVGTGLNNWNTSSITNMYAAFQSNTSFTFDLRNWNLSNVTEMNYMLSGATSFGTSNYSFLLQHLNDNNTKNNVTLRSSSNYFNQASVTSARASLVARGWTIIDNGPI